VRSTFNTDQTATWDVYGTSQAGSVVAIANSDIFFTTQRVMNGSNTVRLFLNGKQVDVKASGLAECAKTPTPTPTATATPTVEFTPTITPTPTATPEPIYVASGEIKGRNGRVLSAGERAKLAGVDMRVVAVDSSGEVYSAPVDADYRWSMELPDDFYTIRVESGGATTTVSRPAIYRIWIQSHQEGLHFAVRLRGAGVDDNSDSGQGAGLNGGGNKKVPSGNKKDNKKKPVKKKAKG
jgi:frataxin-like iron-binding protein CyaY